ncbi:MAG TPA: cyanophycinase [Pyrinomonadaceae bacterium]|nr:cyanophycinase [Chloracidobacterium sp.]MBP9934579.1 cyanophycinase [Pyrinomonadaceae bacterium]MBK7802872.1 cyanophycinase [Chloracidobacterium sp.]MBK9438486.1 cyanophycinase [Chloracidobacterium sp.]MBK9769072.1 cyanophycinase [Chloracidobacterium sp.]
MSESDDREIIGGHLLVIGGAEDKYNERRILKKFLELAGGDKAEILIVPVASDFPEFAADVYTQAFRNLGVTNPRVLRATSRQDVVQADVEKLTDGVTGVFMTGGDQMRLVSVLGGTKLAEKLRKMVRDTNVVMAGTSAGAAAMSTSMIVRGDASSHPHKNAVKLSPGLGFLKNIIIDQHFSERGRISRLITAVSYNPYNLGIGIDENTAIILDGKGILEVFGQGSTTIVDGSEITFNEIAEVGDNEAFSICGVQFHVLRDGLVYNYLDRYPMPPPNEFLLPDLG